MVIRLDPADRETAAALLALQRRAYRVETELIGSDGIPPLHETLEELRACGETFLGAFVAGELAGAISWRFEDGTLDIHRLAVDPACFRRGIGRALVRAALEAEPAAERAIVQTGAANGPARALYRAQGFELRDEIFVGGRIRVARFERRLAG